MQGSFYLIYNSEPDLKIFALNGYILSEKEQIVKQADGCTAAQILAFQNGQDMIQFEYQIKNK